MMAIVDITIELASNGTNVPGIRKIVGKQQKISTFFSTKSIVKTKVTQPKETEESGHWTCELCTFRNEDTNTKCEMCGAKRRKRERNRNDDRIDRLFGGKRPMKRVPLCSGHHLPCVRRQGSDGVSLRCSEQGGEEQGTVLLCMSTSEGVQQRSKGTVQLLCVGRRCHLVFCQLFVYVRCLYLQRVYVKGDTLRGSNRGYHDGVL